MPRTPAEETEYQQLGQHLGFFSGPTPPEDYGTAGYAGRTLANILPGAANVTMDTAQSLLGMDAQHTEVPNFFDVRAPKNLGESAIGIAGNIAQYLPMMALTEGAGTVGLEGLGASTGAARIGGAALGFGLPAAPEGAESALTQGAVGGMQAAARSAGWRGKLAAGLIGGGIGYYEGQKQSPEAGYLQGGLNLLAPTLIDPVVDRILGANRPAAQVAKAQETTAPIPHQPSGPIPFAVSPDGPKDIAGLQIAPSTSPTLPFYDTPSPEPSGLQLSNQPPSYKVAARIGPRQSGDIGGGLPIAGQPYRAARVPGSTSPLTPVYSLNDLTTGLDPNYNYGHGTNPYDIFAGLQRPPILSQGETFPPRLRGMNVGENVTGVLGKGADFTYGRETGVHDVFADAERIQSQQPLSPLESAARAKFEAERTQTEPSFLSEPAPAPKSKVKKEPHQQIPSGLQSLLGEDVGWTAPGTPLKDGFTKDAFNLGKKLRNQKDVDRAQKASKVYEKAANTAMDNGDLAKAQEYANRHQYFNEAVEYATGNPPKAATFRRHDPNYSPNVPHPKWTQMIEQGLDAPVPERGDQVIHWSEQGHPLDVTVTDVKDNTVHYVEHNFMTSENSEKVASLQEFDRLQKHPNDRAAAVAAEPTPTGKKPKGKRDKGNDVSRVENTTSQDELVSLARKYGVDEPTIKDAVENTGVDWLRQKTKEKMESPPNPQKPGESPAPARASQYELAKNSYGETYEATVTPVTKADKKHPLYKGETHRVSIFRTSSKDGVVAEGHGYASTDSQVQNVLEELTPGNGKPWNRRDVSAGVPEHLQGWKEIPQNAAASDRVKVQGKYGWEEAKIVGKEGNTLHVEVDDPIFGSRRTSVLESDTRPVEVASLQIETPKGGVPFQDVESAKLRGNEGARGSAQTGESEADLLGSVYEDHGPSRIGKTLPGKGKEVLSIEEGLKKLPAEAAAVICEIFNRIKQAAGHDIDLSLAQKMVGAKGGMYEMSGRVALNLQWINSVVKNWDKMSESSKGNALMRVAALFGHEVTHVAQKFGERSGLEINGKPLLEAIKEHVDSLSQGQKMYIQEQIKAAKGELSGGVSKYLAGDHQAVFNWYKKIRPNLTQEQAVDLAAGEFIAEVGSVELVKRMNVQGLPTGLRGAIDRFKQVLMNVINWFRSNGHDSGVAALQSLSDIANKMHDHFGAAAEEDLGKAFPVSKQWKGEATKPTPNPFPSGLPPTAPDNPNVVINNTPLLKSEIARLGLRATVGGVAGGLLAPTIGGNQTSVAEGVILGGIAGLFGPAIAKKLLSGDFPQEIATAFKASKGNPIKTMAAIMGNQSLRDMGLAARYGWNGEASTMSKFVRTLEREFNLNLDPKMKALIEEGRGQGTMVLATVQDALDKIRWYKPNADVQSAVEMYFTGKLSKDSFMKLMDSPDLQTYGQSMVAAREGMTTLTQMFASGMPKSQFKDHLIDTADKYLGRFYSAYKEGKFNMEHFDAAKKDMIAKYHDMNDQMADDILREHMREVQANRSLFGGRRGNSGQKIDTGLMSRRLATEEEIEGQKVIVGGLEHDPYSADYLKEKGKLDWMESHKITDSWRDWLGEYKNPTERMIYTFQKVHPSAISAKIFSMLDDRVNSNGLKFSYTPTQLAQARGLIESELPKATHPEDVARLQNQLKELSGYGALPQGSAYGRLSGKWVDRFTRDEINTYATPFKAMEQPILRSISAVNNMIKISRTALNPLTTIRNYIQMPMFGLIAKVNPGDIAEAFQSIHRLKDDTYRTMLERHIIGADYVSAELSKGPGHLLSGHLDTDIATKLAKYGMDKALKFYQQPDVLLRAGAFISARRRFAQRAVEEGSIASLQDAMTHPDVIDKATEFTNRYTMNYSAVPRIVKIGRQLPFVNLFISYTSEITRILKNLSMDAISPTADSAGRMHAITVLGGMAAIPTMLTAAFEGNLSAKDKADWDRVKALSPDYARGRFRLPTSRDAQGRFHYMDITNLLPADSYSQMMKSFSQGDYKAAMAANPLVSLQNTPLLNMATEQIVGEDLQSGRKIDGIGRVREILKETLPPIVPPGYEGTRLINAFSPNDQGGTGLTNQKTGVQYKPSDVIANYLTGMRFGNVQLATVQKATIGQAQQEIQQQQTLLKDVLNTNIGADQKQRAIAIYKRSEEEIMLNLHSRLGQ